MKDYDLTRGYRVDKTGRSSQTVPGRSTDSRTTEATTTTRWVTITRRPAIAPVELTARSARQRSVLCQFTGPGARSSIPGELVSPTRSVTFLATVALDLPTDHRGRTTDLRCYRTHGMTRNHDARNFLPLGHGQRQSGAAPLCRTDPACLP